MELPFEFLALPRDLQGMVACLLGPRDLLSFRQTFRAASSVVRRGYTNLGCGNEAAVVLIQRQWRKRWRQHVRVAKEPNTRLFFERLRDTTLALRLLPLLGLKPRWVNVLREFGTGHLALLKRVLQRRTTRFFHPTLEYVSALLPLWRPVARLFVMEGQSIDNTIQTAFNDFPGSFPDVESAFGLVLLYGFDSCFVCIARAMFESHAKECVVGHLDRCASTTTLEALEKKFSRVISEGYAEVRECADMGMFFD
jgi:hypothetical protein